MIRLVNVTRHYPAKQDANEHTVQLKNRMQAAYPFHPSVLSVFQRKWQSLPRFQRTRGVLRLLALWVAHDPRCDFISGNAMARNFDGSGPENWSANQPSTVQWFRDGRRLNPEELPMQQAAQTDTEIQNTEMELLLQNGRRISLLGSATPLHDAQGRVRGCVGAFLDITGLKEAQRALRQANDQLAEANAGLELKVRERTAELVRAKERLEELDRLIGKRDYREFLNTRNELFREMGMAKSPPPRDQALRLMAANPNLIKRPIVVAGGKMALGFNEEEIGKLL